MVVGSGMVELWISESGSLKEKRAVLRRLLKKTQNEFNVSIAEVGDNRRFVNAKIDHILNFIDGLKPAEVVSSRFEITVLSDETGFDGMETAKYDDFQEG